MSDETDEVAGTVFMHTTRLAPSGMFAQYDDYDALQKYADGYSGNERYIAHLFIGLTYNVSAKVMADSLVGEFNGKHLDWVLAETGGENDGEA